ncbi:MAG: hypothetical protein Q7S28_03990, partial [bacterium]|nr:hypothetical protein [bacterium]
MRKPHLASDELREFVEKHARGAPGMSRHTDTANGPTTGTVIVAFKYKDGVIMAADSQVSWGSKIFKYGFRKIVPVSICSAVGFAGSVADVQYIMEVYEQMLERFEFRTESTPLIGNQITMFKRLLRIFGQVYGGYLSYQFIFAGAYPTKDPDERILVEFDSGGSRFTHKDFAVIGSGTLEAKAELERYFQMHPPSELSLNKAVTLALEAIIASGANDLYVGHPLIA